MGRKKKQETVITNNLAVGILFCLFIAVLLLGSAMLKIFDLVRRSSYDGVHRYTMAVVDDTTGLEDEIRVVSFSPDTTTITVLALSELQKQGDTTRVVTGENVGRYLGIPIDAHIVGKNTSLLSYKSDEKKVDTLLENIIWSFRKVSTRLTILDVARLYMYTKTMSPSSIRVEELGVGLDDTEIDKLSSELFVDNEVLAEKHSIQIINGTAVSGLGNRFARIVSNMGGNVVSVIGSSEELDNSEIAYTTEEIPYTAKKLARVFSIKLTKVQDTGISDIIVRIGKDKANTNAF